MKRSDFDNFNELRRLQKREYERTVEEIVKEFSEPARQSHPIFTDRTTMERKEPKIQV